MPEGGITNKELFERLGAFYTPLQVAEIAQEMADTAMPRQRADFKLPAVDDVSVRSRERFGPKRKTGARKLRGAGSAAAGMIWSARDLRKETGK